jgi:hypothetical protein
MHASLSFTRTKEIISKMRKQITNFSFVRAHDSSVSFSFFLSLSHIYFSLYLFIYFYFYLSRSKGSLFFFVQCVEKETKGLLYVWLYRFSNNTKLRVQLAFFFSSFLFLYIKHYVNYRKQNTSRSTK